MEFEESVKLYLKGCKKKGIEPKRPYSGKFVVRLNPTLHREIAVAADRQGESINKWVERALEQAALGYPNYKLRRYISRRWPIATTRTKRQWSSML